MVTQEIGSTGTGQWFFLAPTNTTNFDIQAASYASSSFSPFAAGNLITTNRFYPTNDVNAGRLQSQSRPDGTSTIYVYGTNATYRTNVVMTGEANSGFTGVLYGWSNVTVLGTVGQVLVNQVYAVQPGAANLLIAEDDYSYQDNQQRSYVVTHLDGTTEAVSFGYCGPTAVIGRDGETNVFAYDALQRLEATTEWPIGVMTSNNLDAAGRTIGLLQTAAGNTAA